MPAHYAAAMSTPTTPPDRVTSTSAGGYEGHPSGFVDDAWITSARESYDRVAIPYGEVTRDAMDRLPFDRSMLDLFAGRVLAAGGGTVVDAGCGPGWLTGHLAGRGLDIVGLDVSPSLVTLARTNHPDLTFSVGSVTDLPFDDRSLAGVLSWYVLHHVPDDVLPAVLAEFARVLVPGGQLLVGGHSGEGSSVKTEGYGGIPMNVLVTRRSNDAMARLLRVAGFLVEAQVVLEPDGPAVRSITFASRAEDG